MAGLNLAAIGAGLGQFAQQYRQQQEMAQRQQLQRLYMEQYQKQRLAKELEGFGLTSGGIPGLSGLGGIPGASFQPVGDTPPGAPSPPTGPQAPAATGAPPTQRPWQDLWQGPGGSLADPDKPTVMETPNSTDPSNMEQTPRAPEQRIPLDDAAPASGTAGETVGAGGYRYDIGSDAARTATGQGGAPASSAAPAEAPPEPVAETKDGRLIFNVPGMGHMDLSSLFRQIDPQAIAKRLHELRPDAPMDAIAMATENLYKMANSGGKTQQLETMALLRYMQATRSQDIRVSEGAANRGVRQSEGALNRGAAGERQTERLGASAERQQVGIGARAEQGDKNRAAAGARQDKSIAEGRARDAARRADAGTRAQLGTLEKQMSDIRARMSLIINGPNPSSAGNKSQIDAYNKQLDTLEKQRDAIADKVLGKATPTE